jgi:hypothetical protein
MKKNHILLAVLLIVSMMPLSACNRLQAEPETTAQSESVLTLGEESLLLTDSVSTNESLIEITASGNFSRTDRSRFLKVLFQRPDLSRFPVLTLRHTIWETA